MPAPGEAPAGRGLGRGVAAEQRDRSGHRHPPGAADPGADLDPRRGVRRGLPVRDALPGAPAGRRAAPRRCAGRQHPRVPLHLRRGGARRGHRRRPEPHPPGRAPAAGPAPRRRRPRRHRAGPRGRPRPDPGSTSGCARGQRRSVPAPELEARSARRPPTIPAPEPDLDTRWALDLHLGHVVGPQGGHLHPAPAAGDRQPHADAAGPRPRRRRLRVHAAVPLQRGHGGLGAVASWPAPRSAWPGASASAQWLPDVRRYGATWFNYTGKPLSYLVASPEQPDDADNPLRVAFGNEGVARRGRRASPGASGSRSSTPSAPPRAAVAVNREDAHARRAHGPGRADAIKVVDDDGASARRPGSTPTGRLLNPEDCVGEIVNTAGSGPFEGYYNNDEANRADHPQRLVLDGRPRLPRRGPLPLLRRPDAPTGSGSTGRTSPPGPSRPPSSAIPTWSSPPSTACPTRPPATR